ncbi:MAG: ABC transporter substrate-binding protein [Firmicutes bacterium]|nr:ABC transporter substrate-binding protein [Alicyclobacillaceae bacterium]MCL6497611.1 ABC transporter substrate-binding protein [Bacillota bacterium]
MATKKSAAAAAAAGLALLVSACGSSGAPAPASHAPASGAKAPGTATASPYVLHVVLGLTGQAATLADTEQKALNVYAKMLNAHGGIDGHPLQLAIQDDENNPQVSVQLMQQLYSRHLPVVLGPTLGETAAPDERIFQNGPTVDYSLTPAFPPPPFGSYVFSAAVSFGSAAKATLNYVESRGWTHIAFLNSTDTTGQSADAAFSAALKMPQYQNLNVVQWQHFDVNAVSIAAQMSAIAAAHPQVLISFATGTPLGTVIQGVVNAGFKPPVITDDGNMTYAEFQHFTTMPAGGLYIASGAWGAASVMPPGPEKTADETFLKAMQQNGIQPDVGDVLPWDPISIVVSALKHYGLNATGPEIHRYIEHLSNYPGVMGVYNFTQNTLDARQRGLSTSSAYLYRWDSAKKVWVPVSQAGGKALPGH